MAVTRQQLTIASFRDLWKIEFLPEIQKEIDSANALLHSEICNLSKRLDEFEKAQPLLSGKYDQLTKILKSTKKEV